MRSFIFLALLIASFAASAQLYRWTDERGRVHVTDTPPPASARNVRQREAEAAPAAGAELPYAVQVAKRNHPVTLFTAPDCAPCGPARALLNLRGVPFQEVRVVDEKQAEELRKAVGSLAVPSLRVGREVQKGFEQSAYHALLDTAGYPRTGILPPRNQAAPADKPPAKPPAEQPPAGENTASDDDDAAGRSAGPYVPR
jgi:glutaredoxin